MRVFSITFHAREIGALGVSCLYTKNVQAPTIAVAVSALYRLYQDIRVVTHNGPDGNLPMHCPQCGSEGRPAIPAIPCEHMFNEENYERARRTEIILPPPCGECGGDHVTQDCTTFFKDG